eukprot:g7965.t1
MTRLSGVVVLLCNDVARAVGCCRAGSSTDPLFPGSSVPPESPYPSYPDAHAFEPPMDGAAGSSYAGSPLDTETGTEHSCANVTTVLLYQKTKAPPGVFEGLEEWLSAVFEGPGQEVRLEKYLTAANTWLHERGADDYTAIFEHVFDFCVALKMKLCERNRINKYMVAAGRPERCSEQLPHERLR